MQGTPTKHSRSYAEEAVINGNTKEQESALDILDKKYANGEIDEEEYKRKKEQLKH